MECVECSATIVGKRSDAKYCSSTCSATAEKRRYRERKNGSSTKRGKNTGRSKTKEYRCEHNAKYKRKVREKEGYKSKYAKALALGFRSMFEVKLFTEAENAGMELEYEPFSIPYVIRGSYLPDAVLPNGIIVEAKGYLDAAACRKMKAVKASNPHLDIRFVFQNSNGKRNKRAKLRNWEWAEKHGFPWAEGTIPLEWWKEKKNA